MSSHETAGHHHEQAGQGPNHEDVGTHEEHGWGTRRTVVTGNHDYKTNKRAQDREKQTNPRQYSGRNESLSFVWVTDRG